MGVPPNNEFFSLSDLLGPSSTFFGSRGVQRLAVVSDLMVSLCGRKQQDLVASHSVTTLILNEYRQSSNSSVLAFRFKVQRQLRVPIARYCLSVKLV
jgi:hypothetical protein